jgi:uncharacterized protein
MFSNWDKPMVNRLFLLLAGFIAVYLATEMPMAAFFINSASIIPVMLLFALVLLLTGIHVHYMMVRSEMITLSKLRPTRNEFESLVGDIAIHDEFIKLKGFHHHTDHIFDHVNRVAFIAYSISKVLSLDYHATARGGMLHDFFLYDWRQRKSQDISRSLHGREHPHIALENARKYFTVSEREADIIVKHMFPKTLTPPRYMESFVVSVSDKVAAVYEYIKHHITRR